MLKSWVITIPFSSPSLGIQSSSKAPWPNSSLIEDLIKNYQNLIKKNIVIICNKAISIKNEITKLYLYDSSEHSSLIKRKSHIIPKREINIESITFEELCKIYNMVMIYQKMK